MLPTIAEIPTRPIAWLLAAALGILLAAGGSRREGLPVARSVIAAGMSALVILAGAKLLYVSEQLSGLAVMGSGERIASMEHGFRLPGGIVLLDFVLPLSCAALQLPWRRFADIAAPAVGAAICVVRMGCFLNGCCFGAVTTSSVGLRFPRASLAYAWQLDHGHVTLFDASTLPVLPLQLYYAALGLLLFLVCRRLLPRRRFAGEVWLVFNLVFFVATFALEFVRPEPFPLNLIVAGGSLVVAGGAWLRVQSGWARRVVPE